VTRCERRRRACSMALLAPYWRHAERSDQGCSGGDPCHPQAEGGRGTPVTPGVPPRSIDRGGKQAHVGRGARPGWWACGWVGDAQGRSPRRSR
jgi:hypothetical protein